MKLDQKLKVCGSKKDISVCIHMIHWAVMLSDTLYQGMLVSMESKNTIPVL